MATRGPNDNPFDRLGEFARRVDELFDDLLITRWRDPRTRLRHGALVTERSEAYEVRMAAAGADREMFEVEVSERRLVIRVAQGESKAEREFDFAHPVEAEGVNARWLDGTLVIVLPKKPGRRVVVE